LPRSARNDIIAALRYKAVTFCLLDKHSGTAKGQRSIETTKDTKSTKKIETRGRPQGFFSCFVAFVLFVVSRLWLRPEAALGS